MRTAVLSALLVGLGGFVGAVLRWGASGLVQRATTSTFPFGTLAVNLTGCFALGFLAGLAEARAAFSPELRRFAFLGVLGGFTTFSTFGYETFALARDGEFLRAGANVGAQVVLGIGLVWLGYALAGAGR